MLKRAFNNALEWALSGVIAITIFAFALVGMNVGVTSAKALFQGDMSRDDIYEGFASAVVDLNTLKDAIDDITGSSGTDVTALAVLSNEVSVDMTAMREWMVSITALYNAHIANTIGEGIHNGVAGTDLTNSIPAIITAPVVTPTSISNTPGTLTTTTPTL